MLLGLSLLAGLACFSFLTETVRADDASDLEQTYNNGSYYVESTVYMLNHNVKTTGLIVVRSGVKVIIDLNGFYIDRGLTKCVDKGSVIRVENGGELTIMDSSGDNSGQIKGGASFNGGGICNHGKLTIDGGTITQNKALHSTFGGGGGIFNGKYGGDTPGKLIIKGGVIKENIARQGAGICNDSYSEVAIVAGTIMNNKADENGGGFLTYCGSNISGGTFKNNKADGLGGGIYVDAESATITQNGRVVVENNQAKAGGGVYVKNGSLLMEGSPIIQKNKSGDMFLANDTFISVSGTFNENSKIGIEAENVSKAFTMCWTNGYEIYTKGGLINVIGMPNILIREIPRNNPAISDCFFSNIPDYKVSLNSEGEGAFVATVSNFKDVLKLNSENIGYYLSGSTYVLEEDYYVDKSLIVENGIEVNIDLNGHKIKSTIKEDDAGTGSIFRVLTGGSLRITDSTKKGMLTGANARLAGGAVYNQGTFEAEGVNFIDCKATGIRNSNGGAIHNLGECYLKDCTFKNCKANHLGGAISNCKIMHMEKCSISECEAISGDGGGLSVANAGAKTYFKNSVIITDNKAAEHGSGVFFDSGEIHIRDTVRIDKNDGDNLYIREKRAVTVDGDLSKLSHIGVRGEVEERVDITKNLTNSPYAHKNMSKVFFPDEEKYRVVLSLRGEAILTSRDEKYVATVYEGGYSIDCISLEEAFLGYPQCNYDSIDIVLHDDVVLDERVVSTDKTVNLDLNGHAIIGHGKDKEEYSDDELTNGSFILVKEGKVLNIKDSKPEAKNSITEGGVLAYSLNSAIVVGKNATLNIKGIRFLNNKTYSKGGAIRLGMGSKLDASEVVFEGNDAVYDKKVFNNTDLTIAINDFESSASYYDTSGSNTGVGGAVASYKASVVFDNCKFTKNKATKGAAAVYSDDASPSRDEDGFDTLYRSCKFDGNKTEGNGGCINFLSQYVDIMATEFASNKAKKGGAIFVQKGEVYLSDVEIKNNEAEESGGGVFVDTKGGLNVQDYCYIKDNEVDSEADNVYLNDDSNNHPCIYSGGVVEGSKIGVKRKDMNSSGIKTIANVSSPEIRKGIYIADEGKLTSSKSGTKEFLLSATTVSSFDRALYILIGLELLAVGYLAIVAYRKRRRG